MNGSVDTEVTPPTVHISPSPLLLFFTTQPLLMEAYFRKHDHQLGEFWQLVSDLNNVNRNTLLQLYKLYLRLWYPVHHPPDEPIPFFGPVTWEEKENKKVAEFLGAIQYDAFDWLTHSYKLVESLRAVLTEYNMFSAFWETRELGESLSAPAPRRVSVERAAGAPIATWLFPQRSLALRTSLYMLTLIPPSLTDHLTSLCQMPFSSEKCRKSSNA